ncbi:hypothetical protein KAJ27_18860 [bacterium]|nr:hypothetical protein [bacterium]
MKKHLVSYLLIFSIGTLIGYSYKLIQENQQSAIGYERQKQFQIRTEEYEPSCSELKSSKPRITSKGSDHFIVLAGKKDFVVFGFNKKTNKQPITAWWSADIRNAIKQACP